MDSLGVVYDDPIATSDVLKAMNLEKGVWVGNVHYDDNPVMAVSMPLRNNDEPIGILRYITSLEAINSTVNRLIILLISVGLAVVVVSGVVSIFLADSIVKPLLEVTKVAEKMADGQLNVRGSIRLKDEIGKLSNTLNYMAEELQKKSK